VRRSIEQKHNSLNGHAGKASQFPKLTQNYVPFAWLTEDVLEQLTLREIASCQSAERVKAGSALIDPKREFDVAADAMSVRRERQSLA
jgi:hypothetical protein